MAYYYPDPSHTFSEYLLVPGYTSEECVPDRVSLKTPLVKYRKGQEDCPISLNIPMVSAIMQSVSRRRACQGGRAFVHLRLAVHRKRGGDGAPREEQQGGLRRQRLESHA